MVSFELFQSLVNIKDSVDEYVDTMYSAFHIDLAESPLFSAYGKLLDKVIYSYTNGVEGADLINWWLFESVNKVLTDKDGTHDVEDIHDFYNYLKDNNYLK